MAEETSSYSIILIVYCNYTTVASVVQILFSASLKAGLLAVALAACIHLILITFHRFRICPAEKYIRTTFTQSKCVSDAVTVMETIHSIIYIGSRKLLMPLILSN